MAIQTRKVFIHTKSDFGWQTTEANVSSISQLTTTIVVAVHMNHTRELCVPVASAEERISAELFNTGFQRGLFDVHFGSLSVSVKLSYLEGYSVCDWHFNTIQDCNALFFKH